MVFIYEIVSIMVGEITELDSPLLGQRKELEPLSPGPSIKLRPVVANEAVDPELLVPGSSVGLVLLGLNGVVDIFPASNNDVELGSFVLGKIVWIDSLMPKENPKFVLVVTEKIAEAIPFSLIFEITSVMPGEDPELERLKFASLMLEASINPEPSVLDGAVERESIGDIVETRFLVFVNTADPNLLVSWRFSKIESPMFRDAASDRLNLGRPVEMLISCCLR